MPGYVSSSGDEAIELARMAGLFLDPWQEFVLGHMLGERLNGKWAAFEVGLVVSRQNGKGSILEARELAGLFLLGERLIIHSAHEFATSLEAFRRLFSLIEGSDDLSRRVKRVSRAHGEEGIELQTGQRIRFRTRTKGGGRGFTGDCLILDEAMILPESAHGALMPTVSAVPNPQLIYTGSAVDQQIHDDGLVFARVRERGLRGDDPALAYFEWSADGDHDAAPALAEDPQAWADANPGLGIRISAEHVAREQRSMDPRTFAVERLGLGDWPTLEGDADKPISPQAWMACVDRQSEIVGPVSLAYDVRPDRSASAIAASGRRADGLLHVEIVEHKPGTAWVAPRLAELIEAHDVTTVKCAQASPAAALLPKLAALGVEVDSMSTAEHAQACGTIFDAVDQRTLRHLGTPETLAAIKGAVKRQLGDAWTWSRKASGVDISPLVAGTFALWGVETVSEAAPFIEVFS